VRTTSARRLAFALALAPLALLAGLYGSADGQGQPPGVRPGRVEPEEALSRVGERAIAAGAPHVVLIRPKGETRGVRRRGRSGVVIAKDVVVTSASNVDVFGVDDLVVVDSKGNAWPARLRGRDLRLRLVVLRCPGLGAPAAPRSPGVEPGSFVFALGAALRQDGLPTATFGIISALGRFQGRADQIDAGLDESNFGGALVDLQGRLRGVVVKVDSRLGHRSGVGFAIPIDLIDDALPKLLEGAQLELGDLGLGIPRVVTAHAAPGVEVRSVSGPAAAAGLQSGDRIVSLDRRATPDARSFRMAAARVYAGRRVEVEVLRDGASRTFELEALPRE